VASLIFPSSSILSGREGVVTFTDTKFSSVNQDEYLKDATGSEVMSQALKLDPGHWGKPEQMRVGAILHRLGWRRFRLGALSKSGQRPWAYKKPEGWGRAPALEQPEFEEPCFDD
jgi:hypothetical protein